MSEASLQENVSEESLVARVADEFVERQKNGEKPDIEEYAARYPEAAELLRKVLAALELIGQSQISGTGFSETNAEPSGMLGDFRIVREVGRGGMGVVYEAEQISLRRRVALKVLPFAATMDPRHLQRFHNEAQAAACLHHTNIVPVHFVGCERGVHFYAMQFIDGQPLSEIIRRLCRLEKKAPTAEGERTVAYQPAPDEAVATPSPGAALTPLTGEGRRGRDYYRKVAELGVQAAEALDHAHQLGIVHRDIKPANLLLDGRGNLWVTDFGLAHVQHGEASLTGTGQMVGTPRYMSPEQALAKRVPIDHRTDVYSLGVTLYELLTLRPAFTTEDRQELLRQISLEEPARPQRLDRSIPSELEIIVLKAMEKRPQDRYATAQELADDLRHWLEDKPIRARRATVLQKAQRWMRRHQAVTWSATVCSLLILAVVAVNIGWLARDRAARRANAAGRFDDAVQQAVSFTQQEKWPEAKAAAKHAAELLADIGDNTQQQQLLAQVDADLNMALNLESARLEEAEVADRNFDDKRADSAYAAAFREYNLSVLALGSDEAVRRIAASAIREQLLTGLVVWSSIHQDPAGRKRITRIIHLADGDSRQHQVWDVLDQNDKPRLLRLVQSEEVLAESPARLARLAHILAEVDKPASVQFLRQAQQRHPDDFWINHQLAFALTTLGTQFHKGGGLHEEALAHQPLEEAIGFYRAAVAQRPQSPGALLNLGVALSAKGYLDEAIAAFRRAIEFKNDYQDAHNDLGVALKAKGQVENALAEYREAIRINKDYAPPHFNLGNLLRDMGQVDNAIGEYREAMRIRKDFPSIHNSLGSVLQSKGQLDEAIEEYREAIRLKRDDALAHHNLGFALQEKGQLDEALTECQEAIRIKKDFANAYCNLGHVLEQKGRFTEALEHRRRGHELGSKHPRWPYPSAQWLRNCERLVELDGKLPAILSGQKQPADNAERLALAQLCQLPCKKLNATALRFYREAFADKPQLADDLSAQHRYNAACAAALAGCGQGKDADKLDDKERARLRQQALDWLRADLKVYQRDMEKIAYKAGPTIAQRMQHWLQDDDFAGVRGDEALAKLPAEERSAWRKLSADVAELLDKAQGKTPTEKKPDAKKQPRDHTGT